MRAQTRWGRILVVLVAAYLGLAGLELVRVLRFQPAARYAVGFFPWELTPPCYRLRSEVIAGSPLYVDAADRDCRGTPRAFRWMGERARVLEPPAGPVLIVPIHPSRPDIGNGVPLEITIADVLLDSVTLRDGGWQELAYYLPPVLAESGWSATNTESSQTASRESRPPQTPAGWLEMTPWTPGSTASGLWLEFAVGTTFVPADHAPTDDQRRLGIGVGRLRWGTELPADGIGFHAWETDDDGTPFRWTRRRASQPLRTGGEQLGLILRADHPDIETQPVEVFVFWEERLLGTVVLADNSWTRESLATGVPEGSEGVLSLRVDRVWTPALTGSSDDARQLGVALSEAQWR